MIEEISWNGLYQSYKIRIHNFFDPSVPYDPIWSSKFWSLSFQLERWCCKQIKKMRLTWTWKKNSSNCLGWLESSKNLFKFFYQKIESENKKFFDLHWESFSFAHCTILISFSLIKKHFCTGCLFSVYLYVYVQLRGN